LTQQGLTSH